MKLLPITLLTMLLCFACTETTFAQKRGERIKNKVGNTPQAKITNKLLQVVVKETLETIAADKDSLKNFPCAALNVDEVKGAATIDFGEGCEGKGGHSHSGIIIIHYGEQQNDTNKKRVSMELIDYKIDDRLIDGIDFLDFSESSNN